MCNVNAPLLVIHHDSYTAHTGLSLSEPGQLEALEFPGIHIGIAHFHQVVTERQLQNLLVRESYPAVISAMLAWF